VTDPYTTAPSAKATVTPLPVADRNPPSEREDKNMFAWSKSMLTNWIVISTKLFIVLKI
jgi:hypothetical protein